ncbi:cyclopropane-fatty-acyl-phospholipid synthase [Obba rivulosa]|uniref:Cyclopropane-fatty-acyl-phospholipid synthase n=1 Tax=Obba rivulosa TaxID=1052685 RepID=A0A8E2DI19_9APHY|nr:cyclopropane-fatty-acyl-phospholipid synthase [Obba rivulosa]
MHPSTAGFSLFASLPSRLRESLISYARSRAFEILRPGLRKGHLVIEDDEGEHVFGEPVPKQEIVVMTVRSPNVWARLFLSYDIGLSEAYMEGDFDVSSLKGLLNLWLDNRATLTEFSSTISTLFAYYSALAINCLGRQSLTMSRLNVEVAYDVSNELYQCFLSKEMMYSCAIWGEEENGVRGDLTAGPTPGDLEAAQLRKIRHILKKARLRPGDRLLEIGSGWGAMSLEAARMGCTVDTVTLSSEQKALTERRAAAAGLAERVCVHLCDYRELPHELAGCFDALVSCEMIEAVGPRHYHEYFGVIDWALKRDRATVVITATAQPEHRYTDYQPDDFARHYHWPNTHLPSATSLAVAVQKVVPGKFVLESIEDHGIHYPRTLREWGRRLEKNWNSEVVAHLEEKYPELRKKKNLEAFRRKWMYMFAYAEVGYARAYTSLNCWTWTRPENVSELCA